MRILDKLVLLVILVKLIPVISAYAADMVSEDFAIQGGNLNMTSGSKASEGFKLTDTVGQSAAGYFSSNGFLIRAGFQYIYSVIPFQFTLSKNSIDLGTLAPETPGKDSIDMKVLTGGAGGYQVTLAADKKLTSNEGMTIENTSCDQNCKKNKANLWVSLQTYGFGYNVGGEDVPGDFLSENYFRPIVIAADGEEPEIVMSGKNYAREHAAKITFKANVSDNQEAGIYQNQLSFVAVPTF